MNNAASKKPGAPKSLAVQTWLVGFAWVVAVLMIALLAFVLFQRVSPASSAFTPEEETVTTINAAEAGYALPAFLGSQGTSGISRQADLRTIIPTRERDDFIVYTVDKGDSIFGIAQEFKIEPETVLWANYDVLNDDPHMIEVGLDLKIPATDGVLYGWKEGDTLETVASKFQAKVEDILLWPGNHLDITEPVVSAGTLVMIPGGQREFRQWVVPTIARGAAGVNKSILGPGACDTGEGGAFGTGGFIWPADNHVLSGNDFWSGHLAIDIAAGLGAPIYAADSGVVVYAGSISGGYGNMVMIDHGNGYQTLYAHLSSINVRCGSSVYQGSLIGQSGSTGRSTGPHLHFEIRYFGSFVNPWQVLP